MLETSVALQIILPMPKLVCQPNLCSLPEYASFMRVIYLFCGMNECNIDFVGVDIDDTIEIAIVSDDDGDYDVKTWAMTTAYKIC